MATKIRLQRHGKKRAAFYHIVIADERAKRDGKFIEKIGTYNPNTDPAIIDLNFDRALYWVKIGAQPTDTARAILSYKGVLLKNHLDKGVAKGALKEADADKKFEAWMKDKEAKIAGKADDIAKAKADAAAALHAKESEQRAEREKAIAAKEAPPVEETAAEEGAEAAAAEGAEAATEDAPAATEDAPAEEAAKEEAPAEEKAEEPAAEEPKAEEKEEEKKEEPKAEEKKEETKEEEKKEEPKAEEKKEEAPAEEKEAAKEEE